MNNEHRDAFEHRPAMYLYHGNGKGNGSAVKMTVTPATENDSGYLELTVSEQSSIDPVRYDWDNGMQVNLGFSHLAKILQVFRGECETIEDGKGMLVDGAQLHLRHVLDYRYGYTLAIKMGELTFDIFLAPHEALGLTSVIEHSLSLIAFGRRMVVA